ncbi:MAG: hypothetical protein DI536_04165 [Archangium gephyra]|uniref:Uncharacterized protein n=1 Tax=Archangium gephyra TaxID=48 RepID=A0A2W5U1U2_9BACT|nr:MAG: hypothetical protein DI536_04165 [Archangium gephyra]
MSSAGVSANHPAVLPICADAAPRLNAALRLLGFPAGNIIVCVPLSAGAELLPGHVKDTCHTCNVDVHRHAASLEVPESFAGCIDCLQRGINTAKQTREA